MPDPSPIFGALINFWPLTVAAGVVVLFLAWKRLVGRLRVFVMLVGGSLVGFLLAVLLHNAVWWLLFVKLLNMPDLDEPVFFVVAVILCPVAFIVGLAGAVVTWLRRRSNAPAA